MEEAKRRINKWLENNDTSLTLSLSKINLKSVPFPTIPENVKKLDCEICNLLSLPNDLPDSIEVLMCDENNLTKLPDKLPNSLKVLNCSRNKLVSITENLPDSLKELSCINNKLTSLPKLPDNLEILNCSRNSLSRLPELPKNLKQLSCYWNNLTSLPLLPKSLRHLTLTVGDGYDKRLREIYKQLPDENIRDYVERIRKYQLSIINLKSHITEKKRHAFANLNQTLPRNVVKEIANYMDEEELKNFNFSFNSLKPSNITQKDKTKHKAKHKGGNYSSLAKHTMKRRMKTALSQEYNSLKKKFENLNKEFRTSKNQRASIKELAKVHSNLESVKKDMEKLKN